MSAASCLLTEDQFLCTICLDVFTDPVGTPCGHNFCKSCITTYWDVHVPYKCPVCKEAFLARPQLRVNTLICQMVAQFRRSAQSKLSSSSSSTSQQQQRARPGDVPCDICTAAKLKALKSCLVCLASYCETHLEPHMTVTGLKSHQLIEPVQNLEGRMCKIHNKPLELFCNADYMCVCMLCMVLDHKTHNVVPLKNEYEDKKVELQRTEAEMQQLIQKKQLKIEEIRQSVELSNEAVDKETAEGVQVFTALKEAAERGLAEFTETIRDKQRATERQAEGFIAELQQEISELRKRSSEVEQLSRSEDHLHLLQSFSSLKSAPPTKDWTEVSVGPYDETLMRAVGELEESLRKEINVAKLKMMSRYAVDVTLDPETAYPNRLLSPDGKQVSDGDVKKKVKHSPQRLFYWYNVLGKESVSSGRFYCEVPVKGKTEWYFGVAGRSMNKKDQISLSPQQGYWTLWLRNKEYYAGADPSVHLRLRSGPERVGVFVDYEEGLVSFYDVDAADHMYSFTGCSFTEKLYLFFNPGLKDGGKAPAPSDHHSCQSQ